MHHKNHSCIVITPRIYIYVHTHSYSIYNTYIYVYRMLEMLFDALLTHSNWRSFSITHSLLSVLCSTFLPQRTEGGCGWTIKKMSSSSRLYTYILFFILYFYSYSHLFLLIPTAWNTQYGFHIQIDFFAYFFFHFHFHLCRRRRWCCYSCCYCCYFLFVLGLSEDGKTRFIVCMYFPIAVYSSYSM